MAGSSSIRGSRIGSQETHEDGSGPRAESMAVSYYCANGHVRVARYSTDADPADIPAEWVCNQCGNPAGRDEQTPPPPPIAVPFKSHLDYLKERRSEQDGEALLAEALAALRTRRG